MIDSINNSILGVGLDLTDVSRIRSMLDKYAESFIKRTFSDYEIDYCSKKADPAIHYAARFAAKEAMVKSLGTGFDSNITLLSVWVENQENGAPIAKFDDAVKKRMIELGATKMHISLTHLKDYAQAIAILSK